MRIFLSDDTDGRGLSNDNLQETAAAHSDDACSLNHKIFTADFDIFKAYCLLFD